MSLTGRVCLITGSTRGIGKGVAEVFANEGATVIIQGRDRKVIDEQVKSLATLHKQEHFGVAGDLTVEADRQTIANDIKSKFSHLDVVIHNAAVLGKIELLETLPISDFRNTFVTNVEAPLALTQVLLPLLKQGEHSALLFLTSLAGHKIQGLSTWGGYGISKFGLEGLAWIMAQELAPHNISVSVINPGRVRTDMRAAAAPSEDPMTLPTATEIAPIFVYLSRTDAPISTAKSYNAQDYLNFSQNQLEAELKK